MHLQRQGGEKNLGIIYREHSQVHPRAEQESIFRTFLLGLGDLEVGVVHLVVLDRLWSATTNYRRPSSSFFFWGGGSAPQTKSWLRLCTHTHTCLCHHRHYNFCLLLSADMHNLIYMCKRYKPPCSMKYTRSGT